MSKIKSWEVSDSFWSVVEPLIPPPERDPNKEYKRKSGGGRKPIPSRKIFEGIMFVLRTGCQWQALPKERFGSPSAIYTHFARWQRKGFFLALWQKGLAEYDDMEGIAWTWQSIDGAMTKAPLAQETVGRNPTDRGKNGTKRHILVDGRGVPLSIVVTGANRHDVTQLKAVLENIVVKRPESEQNLCADKGYQGKPALLIILSEHYIPHVKQFNEEVQEKKDNPNYKPRRWVVEVSHSWFNRFRKILVRFEKLNERYEALLFMAASIIALRKVGFIYE
ncbi:IS5 family transposase [Chlorobium phaeobacteroides]|uniref:IS5 family transposase n=1 Tax=Chlorobium phaeobacteroides TaxID=1096 RepID=UPI001231FA50